MASSYTFGFSALDHRQCHEACMIFCMFVEKARTVMTMLPHTEIDWLFSRRIVPTSGKTAGESPGELDG